MMFFPQMAASRQLRMTTNKFLGLDCRPDPPIGTFTAMQNLTSSRYPTLSVRPKRGTLATLSAPKGLSAKDAPVWCDGATLYYNELETGLSLSATTEKQIIGMGAYLIIFPDKKYINTKNLSDFGALENTVTTTGDVHFSLCHRDGSDYGNYTQTSAAPTDPDNGTYWLDTTDTPAVLRQYEAVTGAWNEVTDTYIKLSSTGIGLGFSMGDGVTVSGCSKESLNGAQLLCAAKDNFVVFSGMLTDVAVQTAAMTLARNVPDMDYITECANRLWGCKYGIVDGQTVNEIYACKLGDFKNWNCFAGLSTDSYVASRGGDGPFTAAVTYLGYPLFFRTHSLEKVYPSASGAHQIVTTVCDGVAKGSWRSPAIADGVLYYLGENGIFAYDGSLPTNCSEALGMQRFQSGVASTVNGQYYISMQDGENTWQLFCYDTRRHLWYREDNTHAIAFASAENDLLCLTADGEVLSLLTGQGTMEDRVSWSAQTGELGLTTMENHVLQRIEVRLLLAAGSKAHLYISYDGGSNWQDQGGVTGETLRPFTFQIRPKRSQLLRLKLTGTGDCQLYTICAIYEKGSDRL